MYELHRLIPMILIGFKSLPVERSILFSKGVDSICSTTLYDGDSQNNSPFVR
ncbi:hypothetical protein KSS87_000845 [Heliosperma pusillum]|nr:hypothetical protein KSS87_000845 [Heliosperma pusillum]